MAVALRLNGGLDFSDIMQQFSGINFSISIDDSFLLVLPPRK